MILIYDWVTDRIALGPHPDGHADAIQLINDGLCTVLNVGQAPSLNYEYFAPFSEVVHIPLSDVGEGRPITTTQASSAVTELDRLLSTYDCSVYVHCIAGLHRSPTILWLYFIYKGIEPDQAANMIADARMDAVPGHPDLVEPELVEFIRCRT